MGSVERKKDCLVCECIKAEVCVDIEVRVCGASVGSVNGKQDCMVCECMVG